MKKSTLAIATATAVLAGALLPFSAAHAVDISVSGIVTIDGVAANTVEVGWFDPATNTSGETVTAPNGAYVLPVPAGRPYLLYAGIDHNAMGWASVGGSVYVGVFQGRAKSDYLYQGLETYAADSATTTANIDLDRPGSIAGVLPPLAGQDVELYSLAGERLTDTRADARGAYAFEGLVPGRYRVSAFSYTADESEGGVLYESVVVVVTAGAVSNAVAVASAARGSISGVVTNRGEPVKGVFVRAGAVQDTTDAKGRYSLSNVPAGAAELSFDDSFSDNSPYPMNTRFIGKTTTVAVTANTVTKRNIALARGAKITGAVTLTRGASQAYVNVVDGSGTVVAGVLLTASARKRTLPFSLAGLPVGTLTMYVSDDKRSRFGSERVAAKAGSTTTLGSVALDRRTVTVTGTVAGDAKYVYFTQSKRYPNGASVKNGRFSIRGVIPGAGTLVTDRTATRAETATPFTVTTKKHSKNLKAGTALATLSATFTAGGVPVAEGMFAATTAGAADGPYVQVENGVPVDRLQPGTATLAWENYNETAKTFVEGSPFWLAIPAEKSTVTLAAGATVVLGAVALTIGR